MSKGDRASAEGRVFVHFRKRNELMAASSSVHRLRVLVGSGMRLLRESFAAQLGREGGVDVVGVANPPLALARTVELHPDNVLFDATRADNLGYAKTLADQAPASKV